jgi:hypothetical protein
LVSTDLLFPQTLIKPQNPTITDYSIEKIYDCIIKPEEATVIEMVCTIIEFLLRGGNAPRTENQCATHSIVGIFCGLGG